MRAFAPFLVLLGSIACAANLVGNPSFEQAGANGVPRGWSWSINGGAAAALSRGAEGRGGGSCVRLSSTTPQSPHVYGTLRQNLRLQPNRHYTLSCYVKGTALGHAWIGGGPEWKVRAGLTPGADWHRVGISFVTDAQGGEWLLLINVDDVTPGFLIDDVQVEEGDVATDFQTTARLSAGQMDVVVTPLGAGRNLLTNSSFEQLGADGLPAGWTFNRGRTDGALAVVEPGASGRRALRLTNGTPFAANVYASINTGEIKVKPGQPYTVSARVRTQTGLGIAWIGGGPGWNWRMRIPETGGAWRRISQTWVNGDDTSVPFMMITESPTTPIDIDDVQFEQGSAASPFDDPQLVLPPTLDLSPAMRGRGPQPEGLFAATWTPELYPTGDWAFGDGLLQLEGSLYLPQDADRARLEIDLLAGDRQLATYRGPAGLPARGSVTLRAGLTDPPPHELTYVGRAFVGDQKVTETRRTLRIVGAAEVEDLLTKAAARLPEVQRRATADDDALAVGATVEWFLRWAREDLADGLVDRAYDAARRLSPMVEKMLASPARPRAPRYVTSPVTIANGGFVATMRAADGTTAQRPVFFTGMGHFGAVRSMVADLPRIGTNIIQVEVGPSAVLSSETGFDDQPIRDVVGLLDRAAKADVMVNLLLSPHYFPAWALAKWPDLKEFNGGFLQYAIQDPRAKGVIERFLRHIVPMIKDHPALHSVCLSNEPLVIDQSRCKTALVMWRDWLRQRYGTIEAVNRRWGTKHAGFDAVTIPPAKIEASALCVDYVRFNQEAFAGWHRWMGDIVHQIAPKLPVHAKIMMSNHFGAHTGGFWSVAPELFADLSEINGNDCCKWPSNQGAWACEWQGENMGYDYQRSAKLVPVFNSENHLIVDRFLNDVSPEFIRNVFWQGAVHGQGATTTWVWERTTDPVSDFAGSIMHRPDCVAEFGRTAFDLNRVAAEVTAISAQAAPVAIVWSQSTCLWRPAHSTEVGHVYTAANFLDRPLGFVNERDAEAYLAGRPNRALDSARIVLVPGATHVPTSLLAALERFAAKGGRVVWLGGLPERDDAGQPLPAAERRSLVPDLAGTSEKALWQTLSPLVAQACGAALVQAGQFGLEARSALVGGRRVVNLCNYTRQPMRVTLPAGHDLLSGQATGTSVEVLPLVPRLIGW
ncbi:MAG: beta-galactosidase [Armatimonadetes bacterium]|nr:beta-galactosidase [Armatimonadota bacterium]